MVPVSGRLATAVLATSQPGTAFANARESFFFQNRLKRTHELLGCGLRLDGLLNWEARALKPPILEVHKVKHTPGMVSIIIIPRTE